jgi:hypothetical protein
MAKTVDWIEIARKYKSDIRKVVVTTTYIARVDGVVGRRITTHIYLNYRNLEKCHSLAQKLGLPESCVIMHNDRGDIYLQFGELKELWDEKALKAQHVEDYASHEGAQDKLP